MGTNGKIFTITIVLLDAISFTVTGFVNRWASASLASGWGVVVAVGRYGEVAPTMLCDVIAFGIPVCRVASVGARGRSPGQTVPLGVVGLYSKREILTTLRCLNEVSVGVSVCFYARAVIAIAGRSVCQAGVLAGSGGARRGLSVALGVA